MAVNRSLEPATTGRLQAITFLINGREVSVDIAPSLLLLDLIREELGLKGTKPGCFEGECGACTVLIDGQAVNSCIYLAANVDGKEVTTIEGLAGVERDSPLHPVQRAMIEYGAVQCGFCTAGVIMSVASYKQQCDDDRIVPDREDIRESLAGNLCRCTGYCKIVEAVESLFRSE